MKFLGLQTKTGKGHTPDRDDGGFSAEGSQVGCAVFGGGIDDAFHVGPAQTHGLAAQ